MQKRLKHYVLAAMLLLAPVAASAQVTIGNGEKPADFSVLELVSNDTRGLRLPQVTNRQRQNIEDSFGDKRTNEAMGLQIFNTSTRCVETWNGTVWISKCVMCGDEPCQYFEVECPFSNVPIPEFMPYNLGANKDLNTPKLQMEYLANHPFNGIDGSVYGGLYQWGRKDDGYAIGAGFTRYDDTASAAKLTSSATYDANGQILEYSTGNSAVGKHIYDDAGAFRSDWSIDQKDDLWGNGLPFGADNLQIPKKTANDPCPSGFRVPTQDEWERLGNYDCDPTICDSSTTMVFTSSGIGNSTTGFTWVAVVCADGSCSCSRNNSWVDGSTQAGFAIYRTEVWKNGSSWNTGNLLAAAAPEPFMFLPAAGYRSSNNRRLYSAGLSGVYWSSAVSNTYAHSLSFSYSGINPGTPFARASGLSVRCVSE